MKTDRGMEIVPTVTFADCPQLDLVMVPGGPGQQDLMEDAVVLEFLQQQARGAKYVTSVCTGSLVLGAAGLLKGKRATSHWAAIDHLKPLGAIPVSERVVIDGNIITGAGVASGIDFALAVAAVLEGEEVARADPVADRVRSGAAVQFRLAARRRRPKSLALLRSRARGAQRAAARGGAARRPQARRVVSDRRTRLLRGRSETIGSRHAPRTESPDPAAHRDRSLHRRGGRGRSP